MHELPRQLGSARHLVTRWRMLGRIARHDIASRYAGSLLGATWIFIAPLLILSVYALVYLEIFRFQPEGMTAELYVLYIFCGLVPYLVTTEAMTSSMTSVVGNKAVLTNTVFPIDLVPVKAVILSLGTMSVGLLIIIGGAAITGNLHPELALFPVVLALHVIALVGIGWILAVLNTIFRDLQNLIAAILVVLLISSPIAYTPAMVPEKLKPFLAVNPFSYYIFAYQKTLVLGRMPSVALMLALFLMSTSVFLAGSWFFDRTKRVLADYV